VGPLARTLGPTREVGRLSKLPAVRESDPMLLVCRQQEEQSSRREIRRSAAQPACLWSVLLHRRRMRGCGLRKVLSPWLGPQKLVDAALR